MGLLDKLKNVFFEEEYVEVEERPEPKEKVTVAKKIEAPEVKKEEKLVIDVDEDNEPTAEIKKEDLKEEMKDFKFPMDDRDFEMEKTMDLEDPMRAVHKEEEIKEEKKVEEEPFTEIRETREYRYEQEDNYEPPVTKETLEEERRRLYEEELEQEREREEVAHRLYEGPRRDEEDVHRLYEGSRDREEQKTFKPSPIISPIYGILNKNYTKDEIMTKSEVRLSQASSVKADVDIIREKAYGELAGDITASIEEETTPKKVVKEEKKEENAVYDLSEEEHPTVKGVTVGDAEEYFHDLGLEYNVDYKEEKEPEEEKVEVKEEKEEKRPPMKEFNDEIETEEDKNLFDLIDSMYEDESEDKE